MIPLLGSIFPDETFNNWIRLDKYQISKVANMLPCPVQGDPTSPSLAPGLAPSQTAGDGQVAAVLSREGGTVAAAIHMSPVETCQPGPVPGAPGLLGQRGGS